MKVVNVAEILAALDEEAAITAVEDGIQTLLRGPDAVSTVLHLGFAEPPGDCHVKAAAVTGDEVFVVKVGHELLPQSRVESALQQWIHGRDQRPGPVRSWLCCMTRVI